MAESQKLLKKPGVLRPRNTLNMRWISLVCLTLQTTSIIILYSYSRKIPVGSTKYLSSSVVVVAEVLKLAFCFLVILKDSSKYQVT